VNPLDLIIIVIAAAFALAGLRQGFLVSVVSFAGFAIGGVLGLILMPRLLASQAPGRTRALIALIGVVLCATIVQAVLAWLGGRLKSRMTWRPARRIDAVGGAVVSIVAVLVAVWLLGNALLRADPAVPFAGDARSSRVLSIVDELMPGSPDQVFSTFSELLDTTGFPQVFNDLNLENPIPVPAPNSAVGQSAGVRRAELSTVKVIGIADSCSERIEGSGFVYASGRVMTNAHVVAGVAHPTVYVPGAAGPFEARVVVFDPVTDVAVLWVPGLNSSSLSFATGGSTGESAAAIGYPGDGPLTVSPARIRQTIEAQGEDIYGKTQAVRQIYSIRAVVRPGNSGGPLVDPAGNVLGVVFAASRTDSDTGYALTAAQVAAAGKRGAHAQQTVGTGGCA
jgi:S1-C subfamily serine protease